MLHGNNGRITGERLPKKLLGSVLALSGILLVLWLFVVARSEYGNNQEVSVTSVRTDKAQPDSTGRNIRALQTADDVSRQSENSSSGIFGGAMSVFIILVVMLAAAFLWFRKSDTIYPGYFNELGRHQLGIDQELIVLEANGEVWVLGRTSKSVSLLFKCNKENWKHQAPETLADGGGFKKILDTFSNNRQWKWQPGDNE